MSRFEDLEVWKNGMRVATRVYELFGNSKDYGLRNQICRAAVSVPSNIAEGYERGTNKEFIRFLRISLGSTAELRTQLYLAQRLGKCDVDACRDLIDQTQKISAQLINLMRYRREHGGRQPVTGSRQSLSGPETSHLQPETSLRPPVSETSDRPPETRPR
jgi:four helix bundle protein